MLVDGTKGPQFPDNCICTNCLKAGQLYGRFYIKYKLRITVEMVKCDRAYLALLEGLALGRGTTFTCRLRK